MIYDVYDFNFLRLCGLCRYFPKNLQERYKSEMLGTSTKTLYKMIDEGHITPVKVGRKYVFAKVKIVEFLLGK